jgi:hypothetical protein
LTASSGCSGSGIVAIGRRNIVIALPPRLGVDDLGDNGAQVPLDPGRVLFRRSRLELLGDVGHG